MESVQLRSTAAGWLLQGTVVVALPGHPAGLIYAIETDHGWHTRSVQVRCVDPHGERRVEVRADGQGGWWQEHDEIPGIRGCIDVDLSFSPSTNTLPLQRLRLEVGQTAPVQAAWLRFPELIWAPLSQTYSRTAAQVYVYQSPGFRTSIEVDEHGLVRRYQGYWEAVDGQI